ncbi:hypothetical protein D3C75_1031180 [compost metagenome]
MQLNPLVNIPDAVAARWIRTVIIQHMRYCLVIDLFIAVIFYSNQHRILYGCCCDDDLPVLIHIFDPVNNGILD